MARVLVTRPQPLGRGTAARLTSRGHDVIVAPLLDPAAIDWSPPERPVEALLFTSPQGPRFAGGPADRYRSLPAFAVGARTAAAARDAGYDDVREGSGDVAALYAGVAAAGYRRVLHLAGADRTDVAPPPEVEVVIRTVYEARLADLTDEAKDALRAGTVDWALLFSTRTAAQFASCHDALGIDRSRLSVAAISAAALAAAGGGWARAVAAATPNEAGILAASGLSCDKAAPAADEER